MRSQRCRHQQYASSFFTFSTPFYFLLFLTLFFSGAQVSATSMVAAYDDQYVKAGSSGTGASWADARGSIQAAIDAASSSDTIYVAQGTYNEAIILDSEAQLFGGYEGVSGAPGIRDIAAYPSIIDGSTAREGLPAYHVVVMDSIESAIIDGFTITGGHANGPEDDDKVGGGIFCRGLGTTNLIVNCKISGNQAYFTQYSENKYHHFGGGMFCEEASPTIMDCTISLNRANDYGGGIYFLRCPSPTLKNCTVAGNEAANGGGIYGEESALTVTNCSIANNWALRKGGGVNFYNECSAVFNNCTFTGNSAGNGGGLRADYKFNVSLIGCTISNNHGSGDGGGVYASGGSYTDFPTVLTL
jgi:parallel beta-helix repeat protein